MKNRKLLLVASLVLAVSMSLGGTLAYLVDTDETVNVMTLGNVDIEQIETDAAGNPFKDNQPLYPAYYTMEGGKITSDITGEIEKVVSVKNEGTAEAFVRTLLAFEAGELSFEQFEQNIHAKFNTTGDYELDWLETAIEVKGVKYYVACADYGKLAGKTAGDVTLQSVYMDKAATNEIVKQFGGAYEIIALSQAVQTTNMPDAKTAWKEAFGAFDADNAAKWFGGVNTLPVTVVATVDELQAAIAKGGTVTLQNDIVATSEDLVEIYGRDDGQKTVFNVVGKDVKIDLNGNDIKVDGATDTVFFVTDGKLDIVGDGDIDTNCECYLVWARSDETKVESGETAPTEVNIYGGNFIAKHNPANPSDCAVLIYGDAPYYGNETTTPYTFINIYGGTYSNALVNGQTYLNVKNFGTGVITVYGGSFKNFNPATDVSSDDKNWIKLAPGYVTEKIGDWYVVGEGEVKVVEANDQKTFEAALDAGKDVELGAGTYNFPGSKLKKDQTITCEEGTVFEGNSKLNINGATVIGGTFSNPGGTAVDQTINGTFKDCTFTGKNGLRWCYAGETVVFENCEFAGDTYGIHFDGGANEVIFKNCTISGFNAMGGEIAKLTMEGCTFKPGKSGYNGINLWGSTDMKDCTFIFDGTKTEWVDACGSNTTLTFTGCVISDGTTERALTAADVGDYGTGNTITVQ